MIHSGYSGYLKQPENHTIAKTKYQVNIVSEYKLRYIPLKVLYFSLSHICLTDLYDTPQNPLKREA